MSSTAKVVNDSLPQYAQVAVPVHLSKTFTYRLPRSMQRDARAGSRVIVPLGKKPITGYIVALLPKLREGTSLVESEIREVEQLLDTEPPLTPQVLEITRWVADYYAAPWGEVMRAALPAGMNVTLEEIVSLTGKGRAEIEKPVTEKDTAKTRALRLLATEGDLELKTFCLRMNPRPCGSAITKRIRIDR
jgi:primosomal protein N' (replication factor Y)